MSKLNRFLLLALVLQLAIVGIVLAGKSEPKPAAPSAVFPNFEPDKVTEVQVDGFSGFGDDKKPQSVKLSKSGTTWGLSSADDYPVSKDKIDNFLKNLQKLKAG